jgi:hypothetical protein
MFWMVTDTQLSASFRGGSSRVRVTRTNPLEAKTVTGSPVEPGAGEDSGPAHAPSEIREHATRTAQTGREP